MKKTSKYTAHADPLDLLNERSWSVQHGAQGDKNIHFVTAATRLTEQEAQELSAKLNALVPEYAE